MQKILTSILLFTLLAQTFSQALYYVGYLAEKKEYMERCVNKVLPQMHCEGKCQLMKKIKEQEEKEKSRAPEMKLAKAEVFSSSCYFAQFLPVLTPVQFTFTTIYQLGTPVSRSNTILHPPGYSLFV